MGENILMTTAQSFFAPDSDFLKVIDSLVKMTTDHGRLVKSIDPLQIDRGELQDSRGEYL